MAGQFHNIPLLEDLRLRSESGAAWLGLPHEGVPLLSVASVGIVLFAGVASAISVWFAAKRCAAEARPIDRTAKGSLAAIWLLAMGLSLTLVL